MSPPPFLASLDALDDRLDVVLTLPVSLGTSVSSSRRVSSDANVEYLTERLLASWYHHHAPRGRGNKLEHSTSSPSLPRSYNDDDSLSSAALCVRHVVHSDHVVRHRPGVLVEMLGGRGGLEVLSAPVREGVEKVGSGEEEGGEDEEEGGEVETAFHAFLTEYFERVGPEGGKGLGEVCRLSSHNNNNNDDDNDDNNNSNNGSSRDFGFGGGWDEVLDFIMYRSSYGPALMSRCCYWSTVSSPLSHRSFPRRRPSSSHSPHRRCAGSLPLHICCSHPSSSVRVTAGVLRLHVGAAMCADEMGYLPGFLEVGREGGGRVGVPATMVLN